MNGHKILVVNATVLFSEIAGELAALPCQRCLLERQAGLEDDGGSVCSLCNGTGKRPFGACYFDRQDGKRQWSLRSTDNGVDVSEIARKRGGGGHKHAAGFTEKVTGRVIELICEDEVFTHSAAGGSQRVSN